MSSAAPRHRWFDVLLAWYFVSVWGSGFVATKIGLPHAALVAWRRGNGVTA